MTFDDLRARLSAWLAPLPHYVQDYQNHVSRLLESRSEPEAMSLAIGGEFASFGLALKDFIIQCGLKETMTLIDVGCGSGRLAYALRAMNIGYLGTDVVPKLVDYARKICERSDWRFETVTTLQIPATDTSADLVSFMSVFTHLRHEESFVYLMEAKRILRPGGLIVFTFLDFGQAHQWVIFQYNVDQARSGATRAHLDQFIDKGAIKVWADHLGLEVVNIFDGSENYIRLSQEIVCDDGSRMSGNMTIGQSACILRKP